MMCVIPQDLLDEAKRFDHAKVLVEDWLKDWSRDRGHQMFGERSIFHVHTGWDIRFRTEYDAFDAEPRVKILGVRGPYM